MCPECTVRLETAVILLSGSFPKDTYFPLVNIAGKRATARTSPGFWWWKLKPSNRPPKFPTIPPKVWVVLQQNDADARPFLPADLYSAKGIVFEMAVLFLDVAGTFAIQPQE